MTPHPVLLILLGLVGLIALLVGLIISIAVNGFAFFLVYLAVFAVVTALVMSVVFFDRTAVMLIRYFNMPVFPVAINLAMSIYSRPDNWTVRGRDLIHQHVGTIDARTVGQLDIHTHNGTWKPNAIERRIIFEAASWNIRQVGRVKTDNLKRTIMQNLAQPVIAPTPGT